MPRKKKFSGKSDSSALHSLLKLNLQMIKNMCQFELTDFINKPDKLLENQIKIAISNNILFLEYLKQSWEIFTRMIPESNSSLLNIQQGADFLKTMLSALTTSDVAVGNMTKSLFSPSIDTDPLDIAKSIQSILGTTTNDQPETPKSVTEDAIKKMKHGTRRISH